VYNHPMNLIVEIKSPDDKSIGILTASPKDFRTGSRGFFANGKLEIEGKRYQVQIQLVEIGSKVTKKEEQK
jgi:hypothetical protein